MTAIAFLLGVAIGGSASASTKSWLRRCDEALANKTPASVTPRASQATAAPKLPSYFWSDADYASYLEWLNREMPSGWQKVANHDLDDVLKNLRLTEADLPKITGRVLLAGEASLDYEGFYAALTRARGNSSKDVVALDLIYDGRGEVMVQGSITRMPFADGSFDHVFSHKVAHYLRSRAELSGSPFERNLQPDFVLEVIRVLRPGGRARIGLFVDQTVHGTGWRNELTDIRAAVGTSATLETVAIPPDYSTLFITKP